MRGLRAFWQKEWLECFRTGKLLILVLIFSVFGILNPALTKLTPWLMSTMADTLAQSGLVIVDIPVDALTSWLQFYKNAPMTVAIFLLLMASLFTQEYERGTCIQMVTKGLQRWKIVVAKFACNLSIWTLCYWLMFAITYGYNAYFWQNADVSQIGLAGVMIYVFGVVMISIWLLASVVFKTTGLVLVSMLSVVGIAYAVSLVPTIAEQLPTYLLSAQTLLTSSEGVANFQPALIWSGVMSCVSVVLAILIFNKKQL